MSRNNLSSDNYTQKEEGRGSNLQAVAFVIAVAGCILFAVFFAVSKFARLGQLQEIRLESRINPNNAPAASLERLPGIGKSRARAIVDYRDDFIKQGKGNRAFQNCDDLQKVKGIGPKTAQKLCQWLRFE